MVSDAAAYSRTRLLRGRVLLLWLLLIAAMAMAAGPLSIETLALRSGFLALAMGLLRLWDDLADLSRDRREHPERVLVNSDNLRPFILVLVIGLLLVPLAFPGDDRRLISYGCLLIGLALLYHGPAGRRLPRPQRSYLVLVKYPVLIFLAGAPASGRGLLTGLGLYLLLGLYEWWHDDGMRQTPRAQVFVSGMTGLLLVSVVLWPNGAWL